MNETEFREKLDSIECIVLDLDGTIYLGNTLFQNASDLLENIKTSGRSYILYTNNSSFSPSDHLQKLSFFGLDVESDALYTSADATVEYLLNYGPGHRLCVLGTDSLIRFFEENGFIIEPDKPDALVLGSDFDFDYSRLTHGVRLLKRGVPFYATHIDPTFPIEHGQHMPDCGALAAALTAATGVKPIAMGKPFSPMLEGLLRRAGVGAQDIAVIGDGLRTDIAFGNAHNLLNVLLLTGDTSIEQLGRSQIKPDFIAPSLQSLIKFFEPAEEHFVAA